MGDLGGKKVGAIIETIIKIIIFGLLLFCFCYMFFGETKKLKELARELVEEYEIDLKYAEQLIQAAKQSLSGSLNPYIKVGKLTANYQTGKIAVVDCKWGPLVDWKDGEEYWEDIGLFWEVRERVRKMR